MSVGTTILTALLFAGCASPNVNPPAARAGTGYVDFYADASAELSWEVQRFDQQAKTFRKIFYDLDPLKGVLRLAFAPGNYRLRVSFLNCTVREPALVDVVVENGKITPVQIKLEDAGAASVQTKQTSRGGSAYGRYGRRTTIGSYESRMFRVLALPQNIETYRSKELMPYAKIPAN